MAKNQEDVLRYVMENQERFVPPDALRAQEILDYVQANADRLKPDDQPGFIEKYGGGLLQLLSDSYIPGIQSPDEMARMAVFGGGLLEGAILSPLEALSGNAAGAAEWLNALPGLDKLPMIKWDQGDNPDTRPQVSAFRAVENFARRAREGLLTDIELDALSAGLTPGEVAGASGLGHFVGFTLPMMSSYKVASTLFNVKKLTALRYPLVATLPEDFIAGAVFGALFKPADSGAQMLKHTLNESALFGITKVILNGTVFSYTGVRHNRWHLRQETGKIDAQLQALREGKKIVITEAEAPTMAQLLSEEGFVANSNKAQVFVERGEAEAALLQGILNSADAGQTSGIVRGLGLSFEEVSTATAKWKVQQPALKFTTVKNKKTGDYDVVFGTQGLSNQQKSQLANEGRFQGLKISKGGADYEYVSPAGARKGKANEDVDWINVRTADGKVTQIADVGVTDYYTYKETVKPTEIINRLYEDFEKVMDDEINMFTVQGLTTEADLITGIRNGSIRLSPEARRAFLNTGAIVHPEEMGLQLVGEHAVSGVKYQRIAEDGTRKAGRLQRIGDYRENGPWGFVEYADDLAGRPKEPVPMGNSLEEAAQNMELEEWIAGEVAFTTPQAEQTMAEIARVGQEAGTLMPNRMPYVSFDDAVNAWATSKGLPIDAPDFPAMKAYFAETYRNRAWRSVPREDRAIFDAIRNEQIDLINQGVIPLKAQAWNKGMHYEPQPDGTIFLRDIRSGASLTAQSEGAAKEIINHITRSDKDLVETLLPFEGMGLSGMTGGWEHPDANLHFGKQKNPITHMETGDVPALLKVRNLRDILQYIESKTGVPLYTQVFDRLDTNFSTMRRKLEPFALKINKIWKGMPQRGDGSRYELAEWWKDLDGTDVTMAEALKILKSKGATAQQRSAYRQSRELMDLFFEMQGIDKARYINHYYSRVRPWAEANGVAPDMKKIFGEGNIPPEFQFWAEMSRTGDLAQTEMDPLIVMHRYARSLFFKQEVAETYHMARNLVKKNTTPRIRDMPESQQAEILKTHPHAKADDPVLPDEIQSVLSEYLNIVRGTPKESVKGLRNWSTTFFEKMGIKADATTVEKAIDIQLANMYGSAMAFRPSLLARNATQTVWTLYTRLGARHGSASMEHALTKAGYEEALHAGAIRSSSAGIPQGDAIWGQFLDAGVMEGTGPVSRAFASGWRRAMRAGHTSSKVGRFGLAPYSGVDDVNRVWSYHWQKMHTAEHLTKFETGKTTWAKFAEEGLPYFDKVTKDRFQSHYNSLGREEALRWIGKVAADEAQWIYGVGAQPAWMQNPVGRFVGMFGTWPLWASELYLNRMWNGTGKQRAILAARTLALGGAFANMTIESGYDMWSYIAPTSIVGYAGGPVIDHIIALRQAWLAPLDQKAGAFGNLARNVGRLSYPGQVFISDVGRALDSDNVAEAGLKMYLGKPVDKYNFSLEVLYDPDNLENYYMYPPQPKRPTSIPGGATPMGSGQINQSQIGQSQPSSSEATSFSVQTRQGNR